ncbi:unnamed protein product [Rotaria sp. Silwood2]|nr:unnamed protein product [Rotaria sp. Silwood2]CAF3359513.1 unnamed protein product [Rotaria sp. Silwood2]CAF4166485.1 unnamed protein product [Rotaria sp. Silwood2]
MTKSLAQNLSKSATKIVDYFLNDLQSNESYRTEAKDLACYFKSPMMFISARNEKQANNILDYIKNIFLFNGDFLTTIDKKSDQPEYIEYWVYINGWIVRAAQKLNRTDITDSAYNYLDAYSYENGGYLTNKNETNNNGITDILTTAHLGLLQLEHGNIERAIKAGNYLLKVFEKQSDLTNGLYLRLDKNDNLITNYSSEMSWAYIVRKNEPQQAYFMIGYPIGFLVLLYEKTNDKKFLQGAKDYMNFALTCNEHVYSSNMSHKLAWSAALLYKYDDTLKEKYLDAIEKITTSLINQQSE